MSSDAEVVLHLAELMDERQGLRASVFRSGDWRQRSALRQLDAQVAAILGMIAFTPGDRQRLGIEEVAPPSPLQMLLNERRRQRPNKPGGAS